jgi:hypothetical protein
MRNILQSYFQEINFSLHDATIAFNPLKVIYYTSNLDLTNHLVVAIKKEISNCIVRN